MQFNVISSALLAGSLTTAAVAQAVDPTIFVANNSNAEGSVAALRLDGMMLTLVDLEVTGTSPDGGTNPYDIDLTPNGRFLATSHATAADEFERITVLEVAADGMLSIVGMFLTPDSPLDLAWLSDTHLAVTKTTLGGTNQVFVYEWDAESLALTEVDVVDSGTFATWLDVDRERGLLYGQNSLGGNDVRSWSFDSAGQLTAIDVIGSGAALPLGIGASPNGQWLYGGGGIADGGDKIIGFSIADGIFTIIPGAPFVSPGASPKQVVVTDDNLFALAAHGGDGTLRSFFIDQATGALTSTGFSYDVGGQGALGTVRTDGDLIFVTDNSTSGDGVRGVQILTIGKDGAFSPFTPVADTMGFGPRGIAWWGGSAGPCTADLNADGTVAIDDLLLLLGAWGDCVGCPADLNGDTVVAIDDLLILLGAWGPCAG